MSARTPAQSSVAVLADTDSRWKWGIATASILHPERVDHFLRRSPANPTQRQLAESGVDPDQVREISLGELAEAIGQGEYQVVILALPGDVCQAALHALSRLPQADRPLVVAGYVGVVYERVVEGLLLRAGADIVLANSPADSRTFRQVFSENEVDPATVIEAPLPYLSRPEPVTHRHTLTFAAQPDVPASRRERSYLLERLIRYAGNHPDHEVVLKVRGLPGERYTHPEPYPYSKLLAKAGDRVPPNLQLAAGPMSQVLARTDLLVTVSSTAAVESIHAGLPTAILTDFGVREGLGNPYFSGSGCLASFDDLDKGLLPVADPSWAGDHGMTGGDNTAFIARVDQLLGEPRTALDPFYTTSRSPEYLPRLLAGHGLAPDGTPLQQPASSSSGLRRAIRSISYSLYRQGVTVVAPALRKLGAS